MKTMFATVLACVALIVPSVASGEAVGYNQVLVPANADVLLTVPFNRDGAVDYTVQSVNAGASTITPTGGLTAGQYNGSRYYVRVLTGSATGLWTTITSNNATAFTVDDAGVVGLMQANDKLRVYQHHTIGTLFPLGMENVSYVAGTQILIFTNNRNIPQQNKSASAVSSFLVIPGVFKAWSGSANANTILKPETQFILRNNAAQPLNLVLLGDVPNHAVSVLLPASGDVVMGSGYPLPIVLKNAGLDGNQRQVLFFNNSTSVQNKSASAVASFLTGLGWIGSATGNTPIKPSEAITFRLPAGSAGQKVTLTSPY